MKQEGYFGRESDSVASQLVPYGRIWIWKRVGRKEGGRGGETCMVRFCLAQVGQGSFCSSTIITKKTNVWSERLFLVYKITHGKVGIGLFFFSYPENISRPCPFAFTSSATPVSAWRM